MPPGIVIQALPVGPEGASRLPEPVDRAGGGSHELRHGKGLDHARNPDGCPRATDGGPGRNFEIMTLVVVR